MKIMSKMYRYLPVLNVIVECNDAILIVTIRLRTELNNTEMRVKLCWAIYCAVQ